MAYKNVDEYIDWVPEQARDYLKTLRKAIKEAVPKAGEKISYGIPTFTLNDQYFIYIAGYAKHVSIHPIPPGDEVFQKEIAPYVAGKGTLKFSLDKPLPMPLIDKVIKLSVERRLGKGRTY